MREYDHDRQRVIQINNSLLYNHARRVEFIYTNCTKVLILFRVVLYEDIVIK